MKPIILYLAIIFFIIASCPAIKKDHIATPHEAGLKSEPSIEKVIKSDCEENIKTIPLIAERFTGKPVPAMLEKSPRLYDAQTGTYPTNYRTKIKEAVEAGVNYAGKYIVAEWGLGTGSQGHAIINAETGRIVSYGLKSKEGIDFSVSSPVLIVNPKRNFLALPDRVEAQSFSKRVERYYYKIDSDSLTLICSEPANVGW